MEIVAITSLPAFYRPNADGWNAAQLSQMQFRTRQKSYYLTLVSSLIFFHEFRLMKDQDLI